METGLKTITSYKSKERALEVLDEIQKCTRPKFISTGEYPSGVSSQLMDKDTTCLL